MLATSITYKRYSSAVIGRQTNVSQTADGFVGVEEGRISGGVCGEEGEGGGEQEGEEEGKGKEESGRTKMWVGGGWGTY